MIPDELRTMISALDDITYLNTGVHGPSPRPIVECAAKFLEYHGYEPPDDGGPYPTVFDAYEAVREDVTAFIGAEAEEVALTQSTTDGINRIAIAFDWEPDDVVVRTNLEHPASILPWRRLEHEGVEVRVVESEVGWLDMGRYAGAVSDADLACFSSLTWNYGTQLPVHRLTGIARDTGTLLMVGAVQSFDQHPIVVDDWGADVVTDAGHKWLFGPWGAGSLYVYHEAAGGIELHVVDYRGVTGPNADGLDFAPGVKRFEVGATSPAPHAALWEAIDVVERVGLDRTEERVHDLVGRFIGTIPGGRLSGPHDPESGPVSFEIPDPRGMVERLKSAGAVVRTPPEPVAVRALSHNFSDESGMAALRDELDGGWRVQCNICHGGKRSYPPTQKPWACIPRHASLPAKYTTLTASK